MGYRDLNRRRGWGLRGDVCGATEGKKENTEDCSRPFEHEENVISLRVKITQHTMKCKEFPDET